MFCLFSTVPADDTSSSDTNQASSVGRMRGLFTWSLIGCWFALVLLGVVAAFDPPWLREAAEGGIGQDSRTYREIGDNLLRQGLHAEAIAAYDRALEVRPDYPEAIANQGVAYMQSGQWRTGARLLAKAMESDEIPKGTVYYNLARYLESEGKLAEAIAYYRRALNTEMSPSMVWRQMGTVYIQLGQLDSAEAVLCRAVDLMNDPTTSYTDMLRNSLRFHKKDSSLTEVIEAQLANPPTVEEMSAYDLVTVRSTIATDREIAKVHNHLGLIYGTQNDLDRAEQQFAQSMEMWPGNIDAVNNTRLIQRLRQERALAAGSQQPDNIRPATTQGAK